MAENDIDNHEEEEEEEEEDEDLPELAWSLFIFKFLETNY